MGAATRDLLFEPDPKISIRQEKIYHNLNYPDNSQTFSNPHKVCLS